MGFWKMVGIGAGVQLGMLVVQALPLIGTVALVLWLASC